MSKLRVTHQIVIIAPIKKWISIVDYYRWQKMSYSHNTLHNNIAGGVWFLSFRLWITIYNNIQISVSINPTAINCVTAKRRIRNNWQPKAYIGIYCLFTGRRWSLPKISTMVDDYVVAIVGGVVQSFLSTAENRVNRSVRRKSDVGNYNVIDNLRHPVAMINYHANFGYCIPSGFDQVKSISLFAALFGPRWGYLLWQLYYYT